MAVALTNSAGMQTTGPVFAINNGIYIGTARTSNFGTTGGYLYRMNPTTGALTVSAANRAIVRHCGRPDRGSQRWRGVRFAGSDTRLWRLRVFASRCSGVFQFATAFAGGAAGTEAEVGSAALLRYRDPCSPAISTTPISTLPTLPLEASIRAEIRAGARESIESRLRLTPWALRSPGQR